MGVGSSELGVRDPLATRIEKAMTRFESGLCAYAQKACDCRPGYTCRFCDRWLRPPKTSAGEGPAGKRKGRSK